MKIVVNHLTRMKKGYICVAGVMSGTTTHVRPVLKTQLSIDLLNRNKSGPPVEA